MQLGYIIGDEMVEPIASEFRTMAEEYRVGINHRECLDRLVSRVDHPDLQLFAISVLILNYALADGRLSVVSPLVACSPVFTLMLGWLVFRERELTGRSVLAVGIVVPSVVLIGWAG